MPVRKLEFPSSCITPMSFFALMLLSHTGFHLPWCKSDMTQDQTQTQTQNLSTTINFQGWWKKRKHIKVIHLLCQVVHEHLQHLPVFFWQSMNKAMDLWDPGFLILQLCIGKQEIIPFVTCFFTRKNHPDQDRDSVRDVGVLNKVGREMVHTFHEDFHDFKVFAKRDQNSQ